MYESFTRGDVHAVLGRMDQHIEWREADNFIYADRNHYLGPQAVLEGVFIRIASEWQDFTELRANAPALLYRTPSFKCLSPFLGVRNPGLAQG
jgi:hypothetical protein